MHQEFLLMPPEEKLPELQIQVLELRLVFLLTKFSKENLFYVKINCEPFESKFRLNIVVFFQYFYMKIDCFSELSK